MKFALISTFIFSFSTAVVMAISQAPFVCENPEDLNSCSGSLLNSAPSNSRTTVTRISPSLALILSYTMECEQVSKPLFKLGRVKDAISKVVLIISIRSNYHHLMKRFIYLL